MRHTGGLVFIACGQVTPEEKKLGLSVVRLVRKLTPFEPYFAENQSTFAAFTENILGALNRSVGLIAIMHRRGRIETPRGEVIRGSVWIEQEIAVAAFLEQIVGRELHVQAYLQEGITREGMREQLLLNPAKFLSSEDVLESLRMILPTWKSRRLPGPRLEVEIKYKERNITQERHDYQLEIYLENVGLEPAKEWWVDILFPRLYMDDGKLLMEKPEQATRDHRFFRITDKNRPVQYPREPIMLLKIPYFVDTALFHRAGAFREKVIVSVAVAGTPPKTFEKSMKELQAF